jgi:crotonobetainyl-CoA:carnitine CoA-transferase CaiB-like acyl-CoA transferase
VWASITGYGRAAPGRDWVAFGDDAAAAGGLVVWDEDGPCFCADAVADPLTGLAAASAILTALREGGRWLIDAAMAGVSAQLAGPTLAVSGSPEVVAARARPARGRAPALGADTAAVLSTVD